MKQLAIHRAMPLLLMALSMVATSAHAVDGGKNRFDCQVKTIHDLQGYVGVRSDTLQGAMAIAGRSQAARTRLNTSEPVQQVVQCVQWPDGKFTDAGFQVWFDEVLAK